MPLPTSSKAVAGARPGQLLERAAARRCPRGEIAQIAKRTTAFPLGHQLAHLIGDRALDVAQADAHTQPGGAVPSFPVACSLRCALSR